LLGLLDGGSAHRKASIYTEKRGYTAMPRAVQDDTRLRPHGQ